MRKCFSGIMSGLILSSLIGCNQTPGSIPANTTANAEPVELEGAPDQPVTSYNNEKFGFTISVPSGWAELRAATTEDGSIFEDKSKDADMRVFGANNEGDSDFQQAIEEMRDATTGIEGGMIGEKEYRATATDPDGYRVHLRLLHAKNGALISALFRYPIKADAEMDAIAKSTLDNLVVKESQ